jgi:transmembrane sensor
VNVARRNDRDAIDQAVDWHLKLSASNAGEEDWLAFERWLAESPLHREAYDRVESTSAELDDAAAHAGAESTHAASASSPQIVELSGRWSLRQPSLIWRPALAASIALFLLAGVALALVWPKTTTYASDGGMRILNLADGTHVELIGHSMIHVRLGWRERDVKMADGNVSFDVAKDASRPFVISVGDRQIRVVGTNFTVVHQGGRLTVTLRRGIIDVKSIGSDASSSTTRLVPGQRLEHEDGQPGSTVSRIEPRYASAFQDGHLIYNNTPLGEVVSDLNEYFPVPIRVEAKAASLAFSGALALDSEDVVVHRLEGFLPIIAERSDNEIILRRKPAQ